MLEKTEKMKKFLYRIWLWSDIKQDYAPTVHPPQETALAASTYARQNLRLPENLAGKQAFEVRRDQ